CNGGFGRCMMSLFRHNRGYFRYMFWHSRSTGCFRSLFRDKVDNLIWIIALDINAAALGYVLNQTGADVTIVGVNNVPQRITITKLITMFFWYSCWAMEAIE